MTAEAQLPGGDDLADGAAEWDRTLQRLTAPNVSTGYVVDVASFLLAGELARALPLDLPCATAAAGALRAIGGTGAADSLETALARWKRREERRAATPDGVPVTWEAEDRPWCAPPAIYDALRAAADALPRTLLVADVVVPVFERIVPPVGGFTTYGTLLSAHWLGLTPNVHEPAARARLVEQYVEEWVADWIVPPTPRGKNPRAWPNVQAA